MPLVRVTGWQHGSSPSIPPASLATLLIKEADMDGSDAEAAVRRLMKGKFVDASFDVGEERAALAFMREADAFGLSSKLYPDKPLSASGSPPRPLFLKLSLVVLLGFGVWLWAFEHGIDSLICRAVSIIYGLLIVCWLYSVSGGILDRRPTAQAQKEWNRKQRLWWRIGLPIAIILILIMIDKPLIGVVLLSMALCGLGFAFLIRFMNRN